MSTDEEMEGDDDTFNIMLRAVREDAKKNCTEEIAPGIQVRESRLHGIGVFCTATRLRSGTVLTLYPTTVIHSTEPYTCLEKPYAVQISPSKYIDGAGWGLRSKKHLGHLFNTYHPALPYPYNFQSADLMRAGPDKLHVVLMRDVFYNEEILLNYHWHVTSETLLCDLENCSECVHRVQLPRKRNR